MNPQAERANELVEIFDWIEDETDRYVQIIDFGKKLPQYPEELRTEEYEVKGCQSKVWVNSYLENGRIYFQADSNTAITKGIVAILIHLWSGLTPSEVKAAELDVLEKIELRKHLTSQRSNGLTAMIHRMKGMANASLNE